MIRRFRLSSILSAALALSAAPALAQLTARTQAASDPRDRNAAGFPQQAHGSIERGVLLDDPSEAG